jgi:RHS repeat-associated protein
MSYYATSSCNVKAASSSRLSSCVEQCPPAKNRVWDFSAATYSYTGVIWSQVPETQQQTCSYTSFTASGVVCWLSKDPIGISGGLNQYVFCRNNPVNRRDPLGLCAEDTWYQKTWDFTKNTVTWPYRKLGEWHYSRNAVNDQYWQSRGLYDRQDIQRSELAGLNMVSDAEDTFHEQGPGNENNVKFVSSTTGPQWWNRYGTYELILRPNDPGNPSTTYQYVDDSVNMGTLNRGQNPISHTVLDVLPYAIYGNRPQ